MQQPQTAPWAAPPPTPADHTAAELVLRTPWVDIWHEDVLFPADRAERHVVVRPPTGRPGVAILPIHADCIGFVAVYRVPLRRTVWEIPRGGGEAEDPREDALRELQEELGVSPADVKALHSLGRLVPDSGMCDTVALLFAAHVADHAEGRADGVETTAVQWIPTAQAVAAAANGDIDDSFTALALLRAEAQNLLPRS
jgi:ADP-ribose pyrophosphatase